MTGGAGADLLVWDATDSTANQDDTVTDFDVTQDKVVFGTGGPASFESLVALMLWSDGSGSMVLRSIWNGFTQTLKLTGAPDSFGAPSPLTAANFVFDSSVSRNVTGTANADYLFGSTAADTLTGGDGDDAFAADGGDDVLSGGSGSDVLCGTGAGLDNAADTFKFADAWGRDIIQDFDATRDLIDLSGVTTLSGKSFAAIQPFVSQVGANVVLKYEGNHLTINSVTVAQVQDDFRFSPG